MLLVLALSAGCEEPVTTGKTKAQAPKKVPQDNFIVGKRTQDIVKLPDQLKKGERIATQKITAKDPITLPGNAYVTIIGRNSILNIQHAIDLWHAEHDRYPKDYDEFMNEIIKANNIALPQLPHYQKYSYDEKEHKLVILEYPDLKENPPP
jgi:hypothetical protein